MGYVLFNWDTIKARVRGNRLRSYDVERGLDGYQLRGESKFDPRLTHFTGRLYPSLQQTDSLGKNEYLWKENTINLGVNPYGCSKCDQNFQIKPFIWWKCCTKCSFIWKAWSKFLVKYWTVGRFGFEFCETFKICTRPSTKLLVKFWIGQWFGSEFCLTLPSTAGLDLKFFVTTAEWFEWDFFVKFPSYKFLVFHYNSCLPTMKIWLPISNSD